MQRKVAGWLLSLACLLSGCSAAQYRWSSDLGRRCFYDCKSSFYQCRAHCFGDLFCSLDCESAEEACFAACPDLTRVN
jgi:hypothetical protein